MDDTVADKLDISEAVVDVVVAVGAGGIFAGAEEDAFGAGSEDVGLVLVVWVEAAEIDSAVEVVSDVN